MALHREAERALIAQTIIDLLRAVRAGRLSNERAVETLLISGAVLIGQHRGKPVNAAAVARQLGVPRSTVLRKLDLLIEQGIVVREGAHFRLTDLTPEGAGYIDKALAIIHRAAEKIAAQIGH